MITMVSEHDINYVISSEITGSSFKLKLRSDGIVESNINDDANFTITEAREYVTALKQITKGVPHPVLKILGELTSMDNEARTYMASEEAMRYAVVEAVIIRNLAQRILASFSVKFDRPKKPVRLFTEMQPAVNWLRAYA